MWLNMKWYDAANALIREDGAYGPIGRTVQDNAGIAHPVQSLLDLHGTRRLRGEAGPRPGSGPPSSSPSATPEPAARTTTA